MDVGKIIAAVRSEAEFKAAIESGVEAVFDLQPDIFTLQERVCLAHQRNKKYLLHIDLANGIGKDEAGLQFVKQSGADGVISTRVSMIKKARELKLFTVQRFFIVDSHSVETTVEAVTTAKPDMIEIMPGLLPKVIVSLVQKTEIPLIAGGLIESKKEAEAILGYGATAVSAGTQKLWEENV